MQIGDKLRKGLRRIGGMLIGEKLATEDQVTAALEEQKQRKGRGWPHKRLGEILVEMSVVSRHDVDRVLAEQTRARKTGSEATAREEPIEAVIEEASAPPSGSPDEARVETPREPPPLPEPPLPEPPPPEPPPPEPPPSKWAFIASKNARVFHSPSCKSVSRISAANALHFESREQAEASGRRACSRCCA